MTNSYDYFRIFYYVAHYHSFNRAAKVLNNSQPNIARAINNLEADLGCTLFERSHRGVTLTEQGEVFFEYVSEAHKQVNAGLDAINRMNLDRQQVVTIGLTTDMTDYTVRNRILPPIRIFSHDHPDVNLRFVNESTPQMIEQIENGTLDLAVITTTETSDPSLRENILYTFSEIPIAGNAFRSRLYGRKVALHELNAYPIITLSRDTETFAVHEQFFGKHGLILNPYIECHTLRQTLAFVESDMGIAAIAQEYAQPAIDEGTVFRIDMVEGMPRREISLIKNGRFRTRPVDQLRKQIIDFNKMN